MDFALVARFRLAGIGQQAQDAFVAYAAHGASLYGVLAVVCSLQWASALLALLCTAVYTLLCAALGLLFNLRLPNFNWTNETVAVKRSGSVVIAMFTNLGILITLSLLYVFVGMGTMNGQTYLLLVTAVLSCCGRPARLGAARPGGENAGENIEKPSAAWCVAICAEAMRIRCASKARRAV